MDMSEPKNQNTAWWITSLAISVICCAILFVVFASYLVDLNKNFAVLNVRLDMLEQRQSRVDADIENAARRSVQQIQIIPSGAAPAQAAAPQPLAPEPAAAPSSPAPPPTAKTSVPELVPGK